MLQRRNGLFLLIVYLQLLLVLCLESVDLLLFALQLFLYMGSYKEIEVVFLLQLEDVFVALLYLLVQTLVLYFQLLEVDQMESVGEVLLFSDYSLLLFKLGLHLNQLYFLRLQLLCHLLFLQFQFMGHPQWDSSVSGAKHCVITHQFDQILESNLNVRTLLHFLVFLLIQFVL